MPDQSLHQYEHMGTDVTGGTAGHCCVCLVCNFDQMLSSTVVSQANIYIMHVPIANIHVLIGPPARRTVNGLVVRASAY